MMARSPANISMDRVNGFVLKYDRQPQHSQNKVPSTRKPDILLAQMIAQGNEQAFMSVIDQYHAGMIRLTMTFIPNRALAEERVSDAWMDVVEDIQYYDGLLSLKTWIFSVLHACLSRGPQLPILNNQISNSLMDEQKNENAHSLAAHARNTNSETISKVPCTRQPSHVLPQAVTHGLASLTPIQRQVITLRDIEKFSPNEVCEILRISEVTYHSQLQLARKGLQKSITHILMGESQTFVT